MRRRSLESNWLTGAGATDRRRRRYTSGNFFDLVVLRFGNCKKNKLRGERRCVRYHSNSMELSKRSTTIEQQEAQLPQRWCESAVITPFKVIQRH